MRILTIIETLSINPDMPDEIRPRLIERGEHMVGLATRCALNVAIEKLGDFQRAHNEGAAEIWTFRLVSVSEITNLMDQHLDQAGLELIENLDPTQRRVW